MDDGRPHAAGTDDRAADGDDGGTDGRAIPVAGGSGTVVADGDDSDDSAEGAGDSGGSDASCDARVTAAQSREGSGYARLNEQFLAHIAVERGLAPATVTAYESDIRRYVAWLCERGVFHPADIGTQDVEDYVAWMVSLAQGPRSVARRLASVHAWHRFAVAQGVVDGDVSAAVKPPKALRALPDVLEIDQVSALLDAASAHNGDNPVALRDQALLEFMYATGARVSEAVGLNLEDIDLAERVVRLTGKGAKQRLVPVGRIACDAVARYLDHGRFALEERAKGAHERRAMFLNTRGRRLSRQSAWDAIATAGRRARLDRPLHPHTLRHSFATHLIQGGADVRTVQELLGHASVTTTQIYTHISPQTLMQTYMTAHPRAR